MNHPHPDYAWGCPECYSEDVEKVGRNTTTAIKHIVVDVSPEDVERGCVPFECPCCEGDGVWEGHPDGEARDCVECSTRGYREAML